MLGCVSGQASRAEYGVSDGRHRNGGVFGVFYAKPVVSSASTTAGAWTWAFELRELVPDRPDSQRQSYSGHVGPGRAGTASSGVCRYGRGAGTDNERLGDLPPAGGSCADRPGWDRIFLFQDHPLSALLDAAA